MSKSRPNLLYMMSDQQTADGLSCAGNSHLHTPAMDRIAAQGVRFPNAYCSQPLCAPARASMMTGMMPREVGMPKNLHGETEAAKRVPWLGALVREAGYDTAYVGKWHLPVKQDRMDIHGFETLKHTKGGSSDPWIAGGCREFLDAHNPKREADQPFFLVASFVNPHDCCQAARDESFPNGEIPEGSPPAAKDCPPLPENFAIPDKEPRALRDTVQPNAPFAYPTVDWSDERWRQYRWQYYRLIEMVDRQIGEVLDALDQAGHGEDTLIIFTSDHGDGAGAHHWNQKQVLYDESARVPLIVADPMATDRGRVDERLVSATLDLMPSLCDYAGANTPPHARGRSVRPLLGQGPVEHWRDAVICDTEFGTFGISSGVIGRMVRTEGYKYIVYARGTALNEELAKAQLIQPIERGPNSLGEGCGEQLFDMRQDPGEMHDLRTDPAHRQTLQDHRARLIEWAKQTDDPFPIDALSG